TPHKVCGCSFAGFNPISVSDIMSHRGGLMIVVTGATGFVGQKIVKRLLANGRQVRCFLAENKPINKTLWDPMPEIITGSLLDEELLFKTVTGADTIIHLENALWWGRTRDLERVELVGTRNLVAAARS